MNARDLNKAIQVASRWPSARLGSIEVRPIEVDAFVKKALAAGAKERKPVMDQFYGDRSGQLEDPFGHLWWVATHKEDIAPDELQKRVQAMFAGEK